MSNVNEGEKDDFGHNQTSKDEVLNSPGEYFFKRASFTNVAAHFKVWLLISYKPFCLCEQSKSKQEKGKEGQNKENGIQNNGKQKSDE